MIVGIPTETFPGERRVALTPQGVQALLKAGLQVLIENGAGSAAGYPDELYNDKGAQRAARQEIFSKADIIAQVHTATQSTADDLAAASAAPPGQVFIGLANPYKPSRAIDSLATAGATLFALEFIPRITRAQSMDVLSSMANLAGYKAAVLAADSLSKIFPMMMTAAGTISPARVLVLGAGVAGLQAIATAKRLGAVVWAYDIRPEVKEQVQSVGGKFVELALENSEASDSGGYAKAQSTEFYQKQQALLAEHVRAADVVITTAAIPGKPAPILLTQAMVEGMRPSSVVIDLAAETGGNCQLSQAGETYVHQGVRIIAPLNLPSTLAHHASQLYSRNIVSFIDLIASKDGTLAINFDDAIVQSTLITHQGKVVHERLTALRSIA